MHKALIIIGMVLFAPSCHGQTDYRELRKEMVQSQIESRGVGDKATLRAMYRVPRHEFVPDELRKYAYEDGPLPIGNGQTISQPYMVAFMTETLRLKPDSKVLEIGTGSGYQAAVLAEIIDTVYTVEIIEDLGLAAENLLAKLGYSNVKVKVGDGYHGWPEKGPFGAIIVTAGAEQIPPPLIAQLKEGGRMIIPIGPNNSIRQLVLATKKKGRVKTQDLMAVRFVPFTREKNKP